MDCKCKTAVDFGNLRADSRAGLLPRFGILMLLVLFVWGAHLRSRRLAEQFFHVATKLQVPVARTVRAAYDSIRGLTCRFLTDRDTFLERATAQCT